MDLLPISWGFKGRIIGKHQSLRVKYGKSGENHGKWNLSELAVEVSSLEMKP